MKYLIIKRFFLKIGFCAGILTLLFGCHSSLLKEEQSVIDEISARWVPDHREGICSVTAVKGKDGALILRGETTILQAKQDIIKALGKSGNMLIDSIITLPDTVVNAKYHGLITLSAGNLRKEPQHSSELVSQAILGTPVLILKNGNGWLLVQTPDKYIAWIEKASVALMSSAEIESWKHGGKVVFIENSGWIYVTTDEKEVVGDLVSGSILVKTGESKGYVKIVFPDGREGFIRNRSVMDFNLWKAQVLTEESICNTASTFLGLPYLWGGSSSKAVDCSGFVQSVYFRNGVILSRDASLQAGHGVSIDPAEGYGKFRKGDLLFFGSRSNSALRVTHVAIYKGDSEFIHSAGRVMISSLDSTRANFSKFRKNSLLAVKQIIGTENDLGIVPVSKHEWY